MWITVSSRLAEPCVSTVEPPKGPVAVPDALKVALAVAIARWVLVQLGPAAPPPLLVVAVTASVSPVGGDAADADPAGATIAAATASTAVSASRIRRRFMK
ncbi:MAG: hypothetical protein ACLP4R_18570 [Solirubrobacteraceae bacterium]